MRRFTWRRRLVALGGAGLVLTLAAPPGPVGAASSTDYCEEKLETAPPGSTCVDLGGGNIVFRPGTRVVEPPVDDDTDNEPTPEAAPIGGRDTDSRGLFALAAIGIAVGVGVRSRRTVRPEAGNEHPPAAPASERGTTVPVETRPEPTVRTGAPTGPAVHATVLFAPPGLIDAPVDDAGWRPPQTEAGGPAQP